MKTALSALVFIAISLTLAVSGTILIPGAIGFHVGIGLVSLTVLCLIFPKKKA